ncbi:MAG: ATP-binding domain-containing protein [Bacteroidales bacterium]|nr:ATP-binding domain-containing protein [Bacteroidales bacterium]
MNSRNKIIFVGDPCQLEPVGDTTSRALDESYIEGKYGLSCLVTEMKEVKRQSEQSGILKAASKLRKSQSSGYFNDFDLSGNNKDIFNPPIESFLDSWQKTSGKKIIIAYKNKTCLDLNIEIRKRLFGNGEISLQKSDIVILGANNYAKEVFNGEFAVIGNVSEIPRIETVNIRKKTGKVVETKSITLKWRAVELVFPDSGDSGKIVSGQVLENYLYGDNYLHPDEMRALYIDFKIRHPNLKPRTEEFKEALVNDPYFHCLKIKYGYAVTCHKAQGGEWENVFTVWDYPSYKNKSFYRWAYTAVTRASKNLYAVEPPCFNSYSSMTVIDSEIAEALNRISDHEVRLIEIESDDLLIKQLDDFGLSEKPIQLQNHFISIRQKVRQHLIEITGWQLKNLEVFYIFNREDHKAGFKTWINNENKFNGKFMKVPSLTNNDAFSLEVMELIQSFPDVILKRNTSETILKKIEFDIDVEEQFPFTRNLFDDIEKQLEGTGIEVSDINHLQYRERFTFIRNQEKAIIDFEYNKNGFFGRVLPIINQSDRKGLLLDIFERVNMLKNRQSCQRMK